MNLPPWAEGPFETILHGEQHYRGRKHGFDGRMALISFDNAIEIAIATYLSLNPIQRSGKCYERKQVEIWNANFHTKLEFLECECRERDISPLVQMSHLVYYHQLRNHQYHEGSPTDPKWHHITNLRAAAIWIFSLLYDVPDVELILDEQCSALNGPPSDLPARDPLFDTVIDELYGMIPIAGVEYLASDLLHAVDSRAYKELALELLESPTTPLSAI